jgi:hypothetical protein
VIQVVVEIHEDVARPETASQLLARDHLTWPLQQGCEELSWLLRKIQSFRALEEFAGAHVQLKDVKTKTQRW